MSKDITTIKILPETKRRIDKLRVYRRETYDEIMQEILTILNTCKVNPEAARNKLIQIDKKRKSETKKESKPKEAETPKHKHG